jgi:hypothetical protein
MVRSLIFAAIKYLKIRVVIKLKKTASLLGVISPGTSIQLPAIFGVYRSKLSTPALLTSYGRREYLPDAVSLSVYSEPGALMGYLQYISILRQR